MDVEMDEWESGWEEGTLGVTTCLSEGVELWGTWDDVQKVDEEDIIQEQEAWQNYDLGSQGKGEGGGVVRGRNHEGTCLDQVGCGVVGVASWHEPCIAACNVDTNEEAYAMVAVVAVHEVGSWDEEDGAEEEEPQVPLIDVPMRGSTLILNL